MRFSPSTIIPSEFTYVNSYDLGGADSREDPPFNVGPCSAVLRRGPVVDNHEGLGKCDVCGTHFRYGEVWQHVPSSLLMTIGHICAGKYGLFADDIEYDHLRGIAIRKHKRLLERRKIRAKLHVFLRDKPNLGAALRGDHAITRDLRAKLIHWGSLSPAQVELAYKLRAQVIAAAVADSALVDVIEGRYEMTGTMVSIKWQEAVYYRGIDTAKMLVLVDAEGGQYKVWGTMPEHLVDLTMELRDRDAEECEGLKEIVRRAHPRIRFTATVRGTDDDPSFGFFKRPTKASLIEEDQS
jgi:hypothetical protein